MKNITAISCLMLSFVVLLGCAAGSDNIIWVPMDDHGFFQIESFTMGEPHNLSYGPYNVLIDKTVPYLTGVQHASGMQTAIENQIGASLHSGGKYILPCDIVPSLPPVIFRIQGKDFVFTVNDYMIKDHGLDVPKDTCVTFWNDTPNKHPGNDVPVLVWGVPAIEKFKIQVDYQNKRVGLVQP